MWLLIVPAKLLKYFVIIIVNRYSCAIFDEEAGRDAGDLLSTRSIALPEGSPDGPDDLERGQIAKLRRVAERARLRPGCRVLDLGCGWGSFAMLAARDYPAKVDTITIALEQVDFARESIAKAGLSDFITVHYVDYRKLPSSFHHTFDAVVSTGVMEHSMSKVTLIHRWRLRSDGLRISLLVGIDFMTGWFKVINWAMKPENSFKVFTMSTVPDTRWKAYST